MGEIIKMAIAFTITFTFLSLFLFLFRKMIIKFLVNPMIRIIMEDKYEENLWEMVSAIRRFDPQKIVEINLRAQSGKVIERPMGSPKKFPNFEPIVFYSAQLQSYTTSQDLKIDMRVTIGPKAKRPMEVEIPILISAMGYGVALSEKVKISLAQAATKVGTAICSGEGAILPEEMEAANKYIVQYSRAKWGKSKETLRRADMIEINLGQGANGSIGSRITPDLLQGRVRELMDLEPDEDALIHETFVCNQNQDYLKKKVKELKKITGGVPVGAKIMASTKIEQDLAFLIDMDVDYIAIDGCQGGTKGGPPIMEDDFGIPTLHGLIRAVDYLKQQNMYQKISIIVSGGLYCPGDFLKAIALGADAVYIGTPMLFAISHTEVLKSIPWEPPTGVVYYNGKKAKKFNIEKGAHYATNFLKSCTSEMEVAVRALGKVSISQVNREDMASYDKEMAELLRIPYTGNPFPR